MVVRWFVPWAVMDVMVGCGGVVDPVDHASGPLEPCEECDAGASAEPGPTLGEAEACEAVHDAYVDRGLEIGCAVTLRECPLFVRVPAGDACLLYDEASVERCKSLFASSTTCKELWNNACVPDPVEGSAPKGCDAR